MAKVTKVAATDSNQNDENKVSTENPKKGRGRPAKEKKEIITKGVEKVKMKAKEKQPKKVKSEKVLKENVPKKNVPKKEKVKKVTDENEEEAKDDEKRGGKSYSFMVIEALSTLKDRKGITFVSLKRN